MDGRVKLSLDHEHDFYFLSELIQDAVGPEESEALINQLGQHTTDNDWYEFSRPELIDGFKHDISVVIKCIEPLKDGEKKDLLISSSDAREWYSTLNQARIHLEHLHQLSELEDKEISSDDSLELIKARFYTSLQGLILQHLDW